MYITSKYADRHSVKCQVLISVILILKLAELPVGAGLNSLKNKIVE